MTLGAKIESRDGLALVTDLLLQAHALELSLGGWMEYEDLPEGMHTEILDQWARLRRALQPFDIRNARSANGYNWRLMTAFGSWVAVSDPDPSEVGNRNADPAGRCLFEVPLDRGSDELDTDRDSISWITAPEDQAFLDAVNTKFGTGFLMSQFDGR